MYPEKICKNCKHCKQLSGKNREGIKIFFPLGFCTNTFNVHYLHVVSEEHSCNEFCPRNEPMQKL